MVEKLNCFLMRNNLHTTTRLNFRKMREKTGNAPWCQFHQHFAHTFFILKCFAQLFSSYILLWQKDFGKKALSYEKWEHKMLMKLTNGKNTIIACFKGLGFYATLAGVRVACLIVIVLIETLHWVDLWPSIFFGESINYIFFKFWCAPFGNLYFLSFRLISYPGLGKGINPGIAIKPFPSSIGWDLNPRPFDRELAFWSWVEFA